MIEIRHLPQPDERVDYSVCIHAPDVWDYFEICNQSARGTYDGLDVVAIDTEDGPNGTWCLTASCTERTSRMIRSQDHSAVAAFRDYIHTRNPLCIIHSALYDIPKLAELGIHPRRVHDTMTMAYLLQDEPLGLKPLAWRHANVKMDSYTETIRGARWKASMLYLARAVELSWPDPEPILVWTKGTPHVKNPQNIGKKIVRILGDISSGKTLKDGTPVHPRDRWRKIKPDEGRGVVEEALGPMPDGYLCDVPLEKAVGYACADADMTLRVYPKLLARLEALGMSHLIDEEAGVTHFVSMMQESGMPIDTPHFKQISRELQTEADRLESEMRKVSGYEFQISSHQQVSDVLYSPAKLNLSPHLPKKLGKKAGKTKTGDNVLAQIEDHHPVVPLIRQWRKVDKLNNTYAQGVPRHVQDDGRVHAEFRTTNTDTGRLSCANPNLMAQPKRNKVWAKKIRQGFKVIPGCALVSMDYSQVELRVLADEAGEESMLRAFREGLDPHSLTALETIRFVETSDLTTDEIKAQLETIDKLTERLPSKNTNFGIVYGITANGLYRLMVTVPGCDHWTVQVAKEYIANYFSRRPGIRDYIRDTESMAKRYGAVQDWAGRMRRIPGARLQNEYKRAEALRQACNARIQTGAQSIIKRAMADLVPYYREWREIYPDLSPLIQIHDDLVSMVPLDLLETLIPVQKWVMENAHTLRSGVKVDVEVGYDNWGKMEDWE